MKGDRAINGLLNDVLRFHLTAINQFFLHARTLRHWGLRQLGGVVYKESIEAMKEADAVIDRILFLEGLPNLQDLGKLLIGQTVPEILQGDLTLLTAMRTQLVDAVTACEKAGDYVSRDLLGHQLDEVEERIDFYETQQELIEKVGLPNYLQTAVGKIEGA